MSNQEEQSQGLRLPLVAGRFYPQQPAALRRAIEEAFLSPLGPGEFPRVESGARLLAAIVVPHAGYTYSASCAAWAFAAAARDGRPQTAVLLGVNHRGYGAPMALSPATAWQTPLGAAPVRPGPGRPFTGTRPDDRGGRSRACHGTFAGGADPLSAGALRRIAYPAHFDRHGARCSDAAIGQRPGRIGSRAGYPHHRQHGFLSLCQSIPRGNPGSTCVKPHHRG